MAGQFYARYVPTTSKSTVNAGKAPKSLPAQEISRPSQLRLQERAHDRRERAEKRKKNKKKKRRLKVREIDDDFDVEAEVKKLEKKLDEHKSSGSSSSSPELGESHGTKRAREDGEAVYEGEKPQEHMGSAMRSGTSRELQADHEDASAKDKRNRKKQKLKHQDGDMAEQNRDDDPASNKHSTMLGKFQQSIKRSEQLQRAMDAEVSSADKSEEQPELHDLVPIPQPPLLSDDIEMPTYSTLPTWLAEPTKVAPDATVSFAELQIHSKLVETLKSRGWESAFAIQAAVLPLLLQGPEFYFGDLCVSAATGSGKTLAYTLPMIEALRSGSHFTRLRGLIIVPTRELVAQVREVVELCNMGLKIGTAVGSQTLAAEQEALIQRSQRYDPTAAEELIKRAKERVIFGVDPDDKLLDDIVLPEMLPDHVPEYRSKVDILICTPGRLVEHMYSTFGFTLDELDWLVIDEADRLLDQSFQEWVDVVIGALEQDQPQKWPFFEKPEKRYVRKIILSATMTKDLQKLGGLKLRKPKLVSLIGDDLGEGEGEGEAQQTGIELPPTLVEHAVPVDDGADKPLYLLSLLRDQIDGAGNVGDGSSEQRGSPEPHSENGSSDREASQSPGPGPLRNGNSSPAARSVLVFTNETENAVRLTHLLSHLHPSWSDSISTLTKSSSTSQGRRALAAFRSSSEQFRVLIATDRAARGLDLPGITDIINYDMPHNVTEYVHRVGRTARAGRAGKAWTLFDNREAWFFWNKIARGDEIQRRGHVKRVRVGIVPEGDAVGADYEAQVRSRYEKALKSLEEAVKQDGKGGSSRRKGKEKSRAK